MRHVGRPGRSHPRRVPSCGSSRRPSACAASGRRPARRPDERPEPVHRARPPIDRRRPRVPGRRHGNPRPQHAILRPTARAPPASIRPSASSPRSGGHRCDAAPRPAPPSSRVLRSARDPRRAAGHHSGSSPTCCGSPVHPGRRAPSTPLAFRPTARSPIARSPIVRCPSGTRRTTRCGPRRSTPHGPTRNRTPTSRSTRRRGSPTPTTPTRRGIRRPIRPIAIRPWIRDRRTRRLGTHRRNGRSWRDAGAR